MIVSIHQPEHFPYLGFFQKMSAAQLFVILDDVKFKKNDYQNRNRFLNRSGSEEWFTVPVERDANSKLINEVCVSKDPTWRSKIQKQIGFNLKHNVSDVYDTSDKLVDINMASIKWCMKKMGISTPLVMSSELSKEGSKSDLLLSICKSVSATKYISGSGGRTYLDVEIFKNAGIEVEFFKAEVPNMMSAIYNVKP
jgi:WbqC-like protein family